MADSLPGSTPSSSTANFVLQGCQWQTLTHPTKLNLLFGSWQPHALLCSREPARGRAVGHSDKRDLVALLQPHSTLHGWQWRHHDSICNWRCSVTEAHGGECPAAREPAGFEAAGHAGQWRVLEVSSCWADRNMQLLLCCALTGSVMHSLVCCNCS
jgi:hypothetical protein